MCKTWMDGCRLAPGNGDAAVLPLTKACEGYDLLDPGANPQGRGVAIDEGWGGVCSCCS